MKVLLTGAVGGLGLAVLRALTAKGIEVVGTDLDTSEAPDIDGVRWLDMDVTDRSSVELAFNHIENEGGVEAVINMAGILGIGSVAEVDQAVAERVMKVNLFGAYCVNQVFRDMLIERQGRIIMISSETGWQTAAPFNGIYAMSKYAVEAYSDALRREMMFVGVKVVKIQPGPFKTNMTSKVVESFEKTKEESILFKEQLDIAMEHLPKVHTMASDPAIIGQTVVKALMSPNPRVAYSVKPNKARSFLEWLPVKLSDSLIRKGLTKKKL